MKLIITTNSAGIDAKLDPRFGRAAKFLIVDADTLEWHTVANPAVNASGGAGIEEAQFVAKQDCNAVLSGDFGPNASEVLITAGLSMYLLGSCRPPREGIQRFKAGQLERLESTANVRGGGRRGTR